MNPARAADPRLRAILAAFDESLPELLGEIRAPWATAAIWVGGHVATWAWNAPGAGGDARPEGPKVGPDTVVRWASLAKPITALIVLRLVGAGRLALESPAASVSRSFTPSQTQLAGHPIGSITIRHLLTHTSGMGVLRYPTIGWERSRPPAKALLEEKTGPRAWRLVHAPGAGLTYGSAAYVWVQSIIEDVTGEPFERAARSLLLDPLGLARIAFLGDGPAPLPIAWGVDESGMPITPRRSTAPAATGVFATPLDVTSLVSGLALPGGPLRDLIGSDLIDLVARNHTPNMSEAWGLGWRLQDSEDGPVFRHAGWPDGVLAYVEGLPRLGLVTCLAIGRSDARRALVRLADIARWHARPRGRITS